VIRLADFHFLLAVAQKYKLAIHQMDVKTAFLNGELENDVYMEIPEGVEGFEILRQKYVCKLNKALYGLRVSPRRWYEKFKETMLKLKFTVYPFQTCIFHWSNGKDLVIVGLYVDDILIIGNNNSKIKNLKQNLSQALK
jgi:hypothetical protein